KNWKTPSPPSRDPNSSHKSAPAANSSARRRCSPTFDLSDACSFVCIRGHKYSSQHRRIIPQHCPPHHLHRRKPLAQESVMKLLQTILRPAHRLIVFPQFHNLQLAERVVKVSGVRSPALRFLLRSV